MRAMIGMAGNGSNGQYEFIFKLNRRMW